MFGTQLDLSKFVGSQPNASGELDDVARLSARTAGESRGPVTLHSEKASERSL